MRHYKDITCFENARRIEKLNNFRHGVISYFNRSQVDDLSSTVIEDEEARNLRPEIIRVLSEIRKILHAADMVARIQYTPPPSIGGYIQHIDILENLFAIHQWGIDRQLVIDSLDRAIGIYESDHRESITRMFNPLWWVRKVLIYIREFISIRRDREKVTSHSKHLSFWVKTSVGFIIFCVTTFVTFTEFFEIMNWTDAIKCFLDHLFTK